MSSYNLDVYIPVILFMAFGAIAVIGALLVGKLVRPHNPSEKKETAYECGELPVGTAWSNFSVRFYVVALIFIIFDVESALMFPVAVVYKKFLAIGLGGPVLLTLLLFVFILVQGVVYCWKKGDLDWVRTYQIPQEDIDASLRKDRS